MHGRVGWGRDVQALHVHDGQYIYTHQPAITIKLKRLYKRTLFTYMHAKREKMFLTGCGLLRLCVVILAMFGCSAAPVNKRDATEDELADFKAGVFVLQNALNSVSLCFNVRCEHTHACDGPIYISFVRLYIYMKSVPRVTSEMGLVEAVHNFCTLLDTLRLALRLWSNPSMTNRTSDAAMISATAQAVNSDGCRWVRIFYKLSTHHASHLLYSSSALRATTRCARPRSSGRSCARE